MHPAEFFRALFPLAGPDDPRAGELVRFLAVKDGDWDNATRFYRTRGELHMSKERGLDVLGFDTRGKDVYFTPHGVTRRGATLTKHDAAPFGDACWLELDDTDLPPTAFSPPPSLVVATSPGRYHLYWLLKEPLPTPEIERTNFRLVYGHPVHVDQGGWALTKWLRVPGTISYKRDKQDGFKVEVDDALSDPDRRHAASDFADLPQAPDILAAHAERAAPSSAELPDRGEILRRHPLSREVDDLLYHRRENRSNALYRLYALLYRAGLSEEETFAVVAGSANDKFHQDQRYGADEDLWKDICRGYAKVHAPGDQPNVVGVEEIRGRRGLRPDAKRRAVGEFVFARLLDRGRLYHEEETGDVFHFNGRDVLLVDPGTRKWATFLNLEFGINGEDADYRTVTRHVYDHGTRDGEVIDLRKFAHYDRRHNLAYVATGGPQIFRLDGRMHGGVPYELVDNGTDGVLFRESQRRDPIEAAAPPPGRPVPTLRDAIFGLPNYVDRVERHTRQQAVTLAELWTYGLFFDGYLDDRPHLVVTGDTDAGKTFLFKMLKELFVGADAQVESLPADRKTFETTVSNDPHVFFDNADEEDGRKWLKDRLAECATGIQIPRRVLFTTNDLTYYKVKVYLGLTTRTQWFAREDIATRIVPLYCERRDRKQASNELIDVVRDNRRYLWFELLANVNRIVARLATYESQPAELRLASFENFVRAACQAIPRPFAGLVPTLKALQEGAAIEQSPIVQPLELWVGYTDPTTRVRPHNGLWIDTPRLHQALESVAENYGCHDYLAEIKSAKSLSRRLGELERVLQDRLVVHRREHKNKPNEYRFVLPETLDEEAIA